MPYSAEIYRKNRKYHRVSYLIMNSQVIDTLDCISERVIFVKMFKSNSKVTPFSHETRTRVSTNRQERSKEIIEFSIKRFLANSFSTLSRGRLWFILPETGERVPFVFSGAACYFSWNCSRDVLCCSSPFPRSSRRKKDVLCARRRFVLQPYYFMQLLSRIRCGLSLDPALGCVLRRWCTIQQWQARNEEERAGNEGKSLRMLYPLGPAIPHFDSLSLSFYRLSRYLNPPAERESRQWAIVWSFEIARANSIIHKQTRFSVTRSHRGAAGGFLYVKLLTKRNHECTIVFNGINVCAQHWKRAATNYRCSVLI